VKYIVLEALDCVSSCKIFIKDKFSNIVIVALYK